MGKARSIPRPATPRGAAREALRFGAMTDATTMTAASIGPERTWSLDPLPIPDPKPGECRVRIEACGICGSDLHFWDSGMFMPGLVPGHEMMGTIDAVGPGCEGRAPGDRVIVEPVVGCGSCRNCEEGQPNVCRAMQVIGFGLPGGLAEYVVAPHERLYAVPSDVDPAIAALGEPIAVSVHGLDRGRFEPGQRVLILGAGTVGLVTLVVARALGAGEVFMSARHEHQAELARDLGATRVLREEEAAPAALDGLGREHDFDLVVETVGGTADTLLGACSAVRPGGAISVLGLFDRLPDLQPFPMLLKECTLAWSNCYALGTRGGRADFDVAAGLIDTERERLARLATHQLPLADVARGFALAADKREGVVKVTMHPGSS